MAVSVGDVVRITARMALAGISDIVNVFHFVVAVNDTLTDLQFMTDTASAMDTLYTLFNINVSDQVTYVSVDGQNITDDELLPSRNWPILIDGDQATSMLPEMNSICVFHRTLKPRVRAAKFLPPTGDPTNVGGVILAAARTDALDFGDSLTASLTAGDIVLDYVAFNRLLSTTTPVTQALVPTRFRTQRRRRLGVGS